MTQQPGFWDDPKNAEQVLKRIKINNLFINQYKSAQTAVDDLGVLQEFVQASEATEEELETAYKEAVELVEELEFKSTLDEAEDQMSAILTINSGAGGTESCDWAGMLYRMYNMWA
ncbi:MAG TPA: PCRF domain-containing protein, partial [Chitinophagales bacterium]|nr:PCRF domain-containing protein [Chitinophagales bacterium]